MSIGEVVPAMKRKGHKHLCAAFCAMVGLVSIAVKCPVQADSLAVVVRSSTSDVTRTLEVRLNEAKQFEVSPVDARVDRVWRAIPGLPGFVLNRIESERLTRARADGKVWLVWNRQSPARGLRDLTPEPIYRAPDRERIVCLMFNVSWGEEYVPAILHTLAHYHIHGTFFLDGRWIDKHPNLARMIVSQGHAIGTHGRGHPDFRHLSNAALEQQFRRAVEQWKQVSGGSGQRLDLFAPPAGAFDMRAVRLAHQHGLYTILWTADTVDWRRPPATVIMSRAVSKAQPGAFILMHPTAPTAQALGPMIRQLEQRGYRFKTVEDVVHETPIILPPHSLS